MPATRKVISLFAPALAIMLLTFGANAESQQDEKCRIALNAFNTSGWAVEKRPSADQCPDDIRFHVNYLASIKSDGSDENARTQQKHLLAAADAGNRSAQLLYTLLFTGITDSKFLSEIVSNSSYSRYGNYVRAWHVLTKIPDMTKYEGGPAVGDGVVEAYLPLHVAKYLEWRHGKWPHDRPAAAAYLLTVADFYSSREVVKPYLRKLLSASDSEMQDFDDLAYRHVGALLIREETRYCRDKKCVADANIKRLICDIRSPKGDMLLKLNRDACDQLSAPLVRLYRSHVSNIIIEVIKSR